MHLQNLQDRHRFRIFNITLFAYDLLFEQQGNSHNESLMNRSISNQGAWPNHCPSSGAVQSRFGESFKGQSAWGKSPPESLGAFQQRIWPDQTSSGGMTKHFWQGQFPTSWGHGRSRKNTAHNQRPARLTYLGKSKGFPANQKGSSKSKGWKWKNCTPDNSKTWKGGFGKKGYPGGLKPRKGGPGKTYGF